ncbi:MAG: hypothetical protein IPH85_14325 [Ignavibacteria bacterium]|nr:hypothetical protein [Ignavibacteria bacterium]
MLSILVILSQRTTRSGVDRTINANLSGVYTIGGTKPGPRNYLSIDAAINDLYTRGVSGAVTFEFTDACIRRQHSVQHSGDRPVIADHW